MPLPDGPSPPPAGACTKRLLCSASGLGRLRLKRTLYSSIFGSRYLDTWGWEEVYYAGRRRGQEGRESESLSRDEPATSR